MSMDFEFAVVPFEKDGPLDELYNYNEVSEGGDFTEHLKPMVVILKTQDEELIPSPLGLSLNITGIENVNMETEGTFLELTDGDLNNRYVLLALRWQALNQLRVFIPTMGTEFRRKFLEVFVQNANAVLKAYGNKAALIIL